VGDLPEELASKARALAQELDRQADAMRDFDAIAADELATAAEAAAKVASRSSRRQESPAPARVGTRDHPEPP
jgi:hypothetical protein